MKGILKNAIKKPCKTNIFKAFGAFILRGLLLLFRGSGDPIYSAFCLETEPSIAVRRFNAGACLKRPSCASWALVPVGVECIVKRFYIRRLIR
jgi:hypothetical protein